MIEAGDLPGFLSGDEIDVEAELVAPLADFGRLWLLVIHRRARMSRVQPSPGDRLDFWKELAACLNRGVRTVRRWDAAEVRGTIPGRIASVLAHAVAGNADGVHAAVSPEVEGVATATDLFPRFLAQGCALAGIPDCAMHWLEIAIGRSFINYPFLAHYDPFFKSLRAHPRFVQLTEIARHRWEAFEA